MVVMTLGRDFVLGPSNKPRQVIRKFATSTRYRKSALDADF